MIVQQSESSSKSIGGMIVLAAIFEQSLKPVGNLFRTFLCLVTNFWRTCWTPRTDAVHGTSSSLELLGTKASAIFSGREPTSFSMKTTTDYETSTCSQSPQIPLLALRTSSGRAPPRKPPTNMAMKLPPSNALSTASTSAPGETMVSNRLLESRRTVHRGNPNNVKPNVTSESLIADRICRQTSAMGRQHMVSIRSVPTGASAETGDTHFLKLLHAAVARKEVNSVRELMNSAKKGENLDFIMTTFVDTQGYTLAQGAIIARIPSILTSMMDGIMSEAAKQKFVESCGHVLNNYSPLHLAALKDNTEGAKILLQQRANPNVRSKLGTTPLHLAVMTENPRMVELLLNNGADPETISKLGTTPLISAVRKRSPDLVRTLLDAGANPRHSVENGQSATAIALDMNALDILEMLNHSVKTRGHERKASPSTI